MHAHRNPRKRKAADQPSQAAQVGDDDEEPEDVDALGDDDLGPAADIDEAELEEIEDPDTQAPARDLSDDDKKFYDVGKKFKDGPHHYKVFRLYFDEELGENVAYYHNVDDKVEAEDDEDEILSFRCQYSTLKELHSWRKQRKTSSSAEGGSSSGSGSGSKRSHQKPAPKPAKQKQLARRKHKPPMSTLPKETWVTEPTFNASQRSIPETVYTKPSEDGDDNGPVGIEIMPSADINLTSESGPFQWFNLFITKEQRELEAEHSKEYLKMCRRDGDERYSKRTGFSLCDVKSIFASHVGTFITSLKSES